MTAPSPPRPPSHQQLTFSAADSKGNSTSATKLDNVKSINFHLPHADQILFNGVQYNGDDDIPIPVGMFGAETLSFTYYQSDYVSVESDMTLVITRVEHYVDMNVNGMLDGYLTRQPVPHRGRERRGGRAGADPQRPGLHRHYLYPRAG
jgi:hypothetical protein